MNYFNSKKILVKMRHCRQPMVPIITSLFPKSYGPLVVINGIIPPIRNHTVNTAILNNLNLLLFCD